MKSRFIVAALLLLTVVVPRALAQCECQPEPRQITVNGTSDIFVEPDEAVLNYGVSTETKTLAEATQTQDQKMKSVLRILRDAGVAEKDIQTSRLQVGPQHNDKEKLIGYKASQSLTIRLRDLSKYEDLSRRLLEGGVNNVYGIDFTLANPRKHADQARAAAVRAAREKATVMASELGAKIGKPVSIVEEDGDGYGTLGRLSNVALLAGHVANEGDLGPTISGGQVRVRAKVTIRFELE